MHRCQLYNCPISRGRRNPQSPHLSVHITLWERCWNFTRSASTFILLFFYIIRDFFSVHAQAAKRQNSVFLLTVDELTYLYTRLAERIWRPKSWRWNTVWLGVKSYAKHTEIIVSNDVSEWPIYFVIWKVIVTVNALVYVHSY